MRTPWGNSQETTVILPGVLTRVETAGHGGFFVHEGYRTEVRPSPTLHSTTWFEEDCDWAVAWIDLLSVLETNKSQVRAWYRDRFDELTLNARQVINRYWPDMSELLTCSDCGYKSTDRTEFGLKNMEDPSFDMRDPYPGYEGDVVCRDCM